MKTFNHESRKMQKHKTIFIFCTSIFIFCTSIFPSLYFHGFILQWFHVFICIHSSFSLCSLLYSYLNDFMLSSCFIDDGANEIPFFFLLYLCTPVFAFPVNPYMFFKSLLYVKTVISKIKYYCISKFF
jgi:hypothetical protein